MRFLHTADWQIGMKAASAGRAAPRVREARFAAAERVVALEADFLLVAGDTFEDNGVDRAMVERTAAILARFRGPVFLLPGNHDSLVPGSVWDHPSWWQYANLNVVRAAGAIPVPGGTLLAAPLTGTHSRNDPTLWLESVPRPPGIVIAMSHGTVEGIDPETEHYPISRSAWRRAGLDYLALGHWHSTAIYDGGRMAYSGTHETTRFGERASGNVLRVTLSGSVAIETLPAGTIRWETLDADLRGPGELEPLRAALQALPDESLVRCRLSGLLHAGDRAALEQLRDIGSRFLHFSLRTDGLLPAAGSQWMEELPPGAVRAAAARLLGAAREGDQSASDALLELMAFAARVEP
ncbi:MAG: DNA repair exonuclease [Acidobacteria bacterium]|nr:DNA repair exonuclease [Acidobacteriota bacterium]